MNPLFSSISLAPKSVRSKLVVAFSLMSLIPMFVFGYIIAYYIVPHIDTFWEVYMIFVITIILMLLGFYLAKKIILPIIEITARAKDIAEGRLEQDLVIKEEDEIGELRGSLNRLSGKLKENMNELHSYGEKIKEINMEINKKVFALSSLLQIGNLITTGVPLDEILNLIVGKLAQIEDDGMAFLMFLDKDSSELAMRAQANLPDNFAVEDVRIKIGQGVVGKTFSNHTPLIIDQFNNQLFADQQLEQIMPAKNVALLPISASGRVMGILGIGNNSGNFSFTDDTLELIRVFSKQVAVAVENNSLVTKAEELTIKDELTGLFNESFIRKRLDEEIKRATSYQRPCSYVVLRINHFEQYRQTLGDKVAERRLKRIAQTIKESVSEIDKAAYLGRSHFAILLPEKNKKQAQGIADNIRKETERYAATEQTMQGVISLTVSFGISATPADGLAPVELINRAMSNMEANEAK